VGLPEREERGLGRRPANAGRRVLV
jgi:hypothetical protein